jgi:hypothetical protein
MSTELEPILPLYIDSTMISCFRSCPEKFRLEFIYGLRGASVSIHLHAGGVFASTLEHFYNLVWINGMDQDQALEASYPHFLTEWGDFTYTKKTPKTRENMWDAVCTYVETYPPREDHVQPYILQGRPCLEFTFAIPLLEEDGFPLHPSGSPFLYSGRFDLLGQWQGKPVVRDEKTTTRFDENWSSQWDLRSQFLGYCWASQMHGLEVDTVFVRGIAISMREVKHLEAIKIYPQMLIDKWHEQLRRDMHRLRKCWDEGYFDLNLANTCAEFGGCQYRNVCASPEPEAWMSQYTVRRWNPVLKNPISETQAPDYTKGLEDLVI